jgi:predicted DNA binding protein
MITECLMTEFRIEGDDCPLAEASRAAGVAIEAAPPLLRADGNVLLRFSAPPRDGLSEILDADDRLRYLHRAETDGRYNFRCLSLHPCVVHELVDAGFMAESLRYEHGNAVLTGAVVGHEVLRGVMETAGETVGVHLKRVYALRAADDEPVGRQWDLTPAQEESLRQALAMDYFTVPRGATAAEVAEALDISKSAFIERLHRAQHALLSQLFEGEPTPDADDAPDSTGPGSA